MQYLNTIANVGRPFSYGSFRPLLPSHDGDVKTFSGKAHVYEDQKHIVSRLFSYGIPVAEIVATSEGDKIIVMDYRKIIRDESCAKRRWEAVFRHIREFLYEHGYSVETNDDLIPFLAQEEEPSPAPAPAESRVAHWVRNEHPRKPEEAWYTCSHCGMLAVADNGNDILSDYCPHCGFEMSESHDGRTLCWWRKNIFFKNYGVEVQHTAESKGKKIKAFRDADTKQPVIALIKRKGKWIIAPNANHVTFYRAFQTDTLRFVKPEEVESYA